MTRVEPDDRERPSPYLGDYPRAYWSAVLPEGVEDVEAEEESFNGSDLRLMWDEGAGPLWTTEDGLLPDDPRWLQRTLGLSDSLVADLLRWMQDMDAGWPTPNLDRTAEHLVDRLRAELGSRFTVRYHR